MSLFSLDINMASLRIIVIILMVSSMIESRPSSELQSSSSSSSSELNKSRRSSSNKPDILRQHLKQALSKCNSREPPPTLKVLLKDNKSGAVCNDGSPAGYMTYIIPFLPFSFIHNSMIYYHKGISSVNLMEVSAGSSIWKADGIVTIRRAANHDGIG